jgi:hypothetical protein
MPWFVVAQGDSGKTHSECKEEDSLGERPTRRMEDNHNGQHFFLAACQLPNG